MLRSGLAVVFAASTGAGALAAFASPERAGQTPARTVHVSVTDGKGVPVTDLAAADFTVKEDGKACEVLSAERAATPLSVALLIDDNGVGANDVRNGAAGFIKRLQGQAEIAIVTTAGQNVTRVDYTRSLAALIAGVSQLLTRPAPPGGHVLEAIMEAARELEARKASRSAIVVGHPAAAASGVAENMNRSKVLGDGPKQSGGRHELMIATAGLPKALLLIADDLANQYAVAYNLPAGVKPSGKIAVAVTRRGVTLRAPNRVPER